MDHLARAKEILGELIAFPTISADSNLQLIAYASELLSQVGARISVMRDETGTKANLFATLGPRRRRYRTLRAFRRRAGGWAELEFRSFHHARRGWPSLRARHL